MSVKSNQDITKKIWMGFVAFASVGVCILTWQVFVAGETIYEGIEIVMPHMLGQINASAFSFYIHFIFAPLALLVMPFQFWAGIRRKSLGLHRWLGRAYVIAVLVGGVGGMLMSFNTESAHITAVGFGILAFLWIYTTVRAYMAIRNKDINEHKRWMLRSASLTFGAVTLRVMVPLGQMLDEAGLVPFEYVYTFTAWHWGVILPLVEWWIIRNWPYRDARKQAA